MLRWSLLDITKEATFSTRPPHPPPPPPHSLKWIPRVGPCHFHSRSGIHSPHGHLELVTDTTFQMDTSLTRTLKAIL